MRANVHANVQVISGCVRTCLGRNICILITSARPYSRLASFQALLWYGRFCLLHTCTLTAGFPNLVELGNSARYTIYMGQCYMLLPYPARSYALLVLSEIFELVGLVQTNNSFCVALPPPVYPRPQPYSKKVCLAKVVHYAWSLTCCL